MLPFETEVLVDERTASCMIDQFIDNECICINNNPNSNPMTSNEITRTDQSTSHETVKVTKSYAINNGIIEESYFDIESMEDANDFINDFANSYPSGIILVVDQAPINDQTRLLSLQLEPYLKQTFVCSGQPGSDISTASKTAYNVATTGQAILFQGVCKNFDLLSYIF